MKFSIFERISSQKFTKGPEQATSEGQYIDKSTKL
jgi:hypothetical protein